MDKTEVEKKKRYVRRREKELVNTEKRKTVYSFIHEVPAHSSLLLTTFNVVCSCISLQYPEFKVLRHQRTGRLSSRITRLNRGPEALSSIHVFHTCQTEKDLFSTVVPYE
jgi:hypothetical protein